MISLGEFDHLQIILYDTDYYFIVWVPLRFVLIETIIYTISFSQDERRVLVSHGHNAKRRICLHNNVDSYEFLHCYRVV